MRLALIKNSVVINVVVADQIAVDKFGADHVIASDIAGVGDTYAGGEFTPPVGETPTPAAAIAWSDTNLNPAYWQIDSGPFKDRFDKFGYPGLKFNLLALGRTNDTAYAAVADLNGREFVELKARRTELVTMLNALSAILSAAGKPPITAAMINAILDTYTTDYERHTKNLVQPV